jgi:hypothetical protein
VDHSVLRAEATALLTVTASSTSMNGSPAALLMVHLSPGLQLVTGETSGLTWSVPALAADEVEVSGGSLLTLTKDYFFNSQRVALHKNGTLLYLHADHLGSTRMV